MFARISIPVDEGQQHISESDASSPLGRRAQSKWLSAVLPFYSDGYWPKTGASPFVLPLHVFRSSPISRNTLPIKIMLGDGLSSLARNLRRCVIGARSFLLETAI
jgi:hypothetical protein